MFSQFQFTMKYYKEHTQTQETRIYTHLMMVMKSLFIFLLLKSTSDNFLSLISLNGIHDTHF